MLIIQSMRIGAFPFHVNILNDLTHKRLILMKDVLIYIHNDKIYIFIAPKCSSQAKHYVK